MLRFNFRICLGDRGGRVLVGTKELFSQSNALLLNCIADINIPRGTKFREFKWRAGDSLTITF